MSEPISPPDALLVVEEAPSNPELVGARFELSAAKAADGRGYCVGRAKGAEICLPAAHLSRCTLFVRREAGGWYLEDTGSVNLPQVQGVPVQRHALADGDLFVVGAAVAVLRFTIPSPS